MLDQVAAPARLRFRFVGVWHPVLLNDLSSQALIKDFVNEIVGRRDEDASARARLRRDFEEIIAQAVAGQAEAMFVVTEVAGAPLFATLTVRPVHEVRIAPAVGDSPGEIIRVLAESFREFEREGIDTASVIELDRGQALRLHRLRDEEYHEQGSTLTARALSVDYWCTVPGTKHVLLVNFMTPMGDIAHVMLAFFDAIVRASYFEVVPPAQGEIGAPTPT